MIVLTQYLIRDISVCWLYFYKKSELSNLKKSFLVLALLNSDSTLFTGNSDWFYIRKHTFCRSDLPLPVYRICKLSADPTPGHVINVRIAHCMENYLNCSYVIMGDTLCYNILP